MVRLYRNVRVEACGTKSSENENALCLRSAEPATTTESRRATLHVLDNQVVFKVFWYLK
jgi:hypothetical protein